MRNLGYTRVYMIMLCTVLTTVLYGQLDCANQSPPANDFCANAILLNSVITGSTCCSSIENISQCSNMDNGVWYTYAQQGNGTEITVNNIDIFGPISIEIYSGSCANLSLIAQTDCAGFQSRTIRIPNCYNIICIHIASTEDGCGTFEILANDINECKFAETCNSITPDLTFNPESDGQRECITSCMQYACDGICTEQGVWFQINTDNDASAIQLSVENAEFNPIISVYRGESCGDTEDLIFCQDLSLGEFTNFDVVPNFTYFVQVSAGNGEASQFDLCVSSVKDFIDCSSGTLTCSRPMFPNENQFGPYCPGETIVFCYEVEFYVDIPGQGNNCQWLQGIIPVIGGGWDKAASNLQGQAPANWEWLDEGNVDYNVNSEVLSIGSNPEGILTLEYGSGGITEGDQLPGGWWYTSPGGTGCSNDGDPDNMYGLEFPCGQIMTFTHCFELVARDVQDIEDCNDGYSTDLSVTIFNLADGETGCYNDVTCSGDTPVVFNGSIDCSQLIEIYAEDKEICSGEFTEIPITITEGFEIPVEIEVLDAGNTTGAQNWTFESGAGVIPDQITNLGDKIETIRYKAYVNDNSSICEATEIEFELIVHPPLPLEVPEDEFLVCTGDSIIYSAPDGFDSYEWYDPSGYLVSQERDVKLIEQGDYTLIVYKGICKARRPVRLNQSNPFPAGLTVNRIRVCDDYVGTYPTSIDLTNYHYTFVQGIWYDESGNIIDEPSDMDYSGMPSGSLNYYFETTNAPDPCPNNGYLLEIIIEDCECPEIDVLPLPALCAETQSLDLSDYEIASQPGYWTIVDGPDINSMSINNGELMVLDGTLGGDYTLSFTLYDISATPACNDEIQTVLTIIEKPEAEILDLAVACDAHTGFHPEVIDLDDLFISGSPGEWSNTDGFAIASDNTVVFTNVDPGVYEFIYTTNDAEAPCENISYATQIYVEDCSCPDLEINEPGDQCQEYTEIDLDDLISEADPGTWSIEALNGQLVPEITSGNILVIDENSEAGDYLLVYTLSQANIHPDCAPYRELPLFIEEKPYADLVPSVDACNGFDGDLPISFALDSLLISTNVSGAWVSNNPDLKLGQDSVDLFGLETGTYELVFTTDDARDPCENISVSTFINVTECSCPQLELAAVPDLCKGSGPMELNSYLSTNAPGSWEIRGPLGTSDIFVMNNMIQHGDATLPGIYELVYKLDPLGYDQRCITKATVMFEIFEEPVAEIVNYLEVCNDDIGTDPDRIYLNDYFLSGSPGTWASADNLNITSDSEVVFAGMAAGEYTFYYTTNTAMVPCSDNTYELTVRVNDCKCPVLELAPLDNACNDGSVINLEDYLDNPTGAEGSWEIMRATSILGDVPVFSTDTLEPGLYTVSYKWNEKPIGTCNDKVSGIFQVFEQPWVETVSEMTVCNMENGNFPHCLDFTQLAQGSDGEWIAPPSFTGDFSDLTNVCFSGLSGGGFYIFRYASNVAEAPCTEVSDQMIVIVKQCSCPSAELIIPGPMCNENDVLQLSDMETNGLAPGEWSFFGGPQTIDISSGYFDATGVQPGLYTFEYTLDEIVASHCVQSRRINIEVVPVYYAGQGSVLEICEQTDTVFQLFDFLKGADSGGVWKDKSVVAAAQLSDDGALDVSTLMAGNYEFQYYYENESPCENDSSSIILTVHPVPVADAGPDKEMNCVIREVSIGSENLPQDPIIQYVWSDENGNILSSGGDISILVDTPGDYYLESINSLTGCRNFDKVTVTEDTVYPAFEAEVTSSPCEYEAPGIIEIFDVVNASGMPRFSIDGGSTWTTMPFFENLDAGEYTVILEDERGCRAEYPGIHVDRSQPMGLFAGEDQTVQYGENFLDLTPELSIDPAQVEMVIWEQDGVVICEGSYADCFTISVDPMDINTYCVTVIDYNGCSEKDCITVEEELVPLVYMPNIFDPGSYDINNRVFVQTDENIETINEFIIYDRWGNLVFESEPDHKPNDPSYGWNGFLNGKFALEGIYIYHIRFTDVLQEEHEKSGDVMLVR